MEYPKYCRCINKDWMYDPEYPKDKGLYGLIYKIDYFEDKTGVVHIDEDQTLYYNDKQFEPVTQLEYIKSINLKEALINLAKSEKYQIKIRSKIEATKLDKIFFILDHSDYKKPNNSLKNWWYQDSTPILFSLSILNTSDNKITITLDNILDYV